MKNTLYGTLATALIITLSILILVQGANIVSENMNKAYSTGKVDSASLDNCDNAVIPAFLYFQQREPYVYKFSVMGTHIELNIKKYSDILSWTKAELQYIMDKFYKLAGWHNVNEALE